MSPAHAPATARYRVTRTIYMGHYDPSEVAVDPRTRTVYVTNWLYDSVSVISRGR